jgi:hypothetical protein
VHARRYLLALVEAYSANLMKEVALNFALQVTALPQLCHGARLCTASALSRTGVCLIVHAVYEVPTKRAACSAQAAEQGAVVDDLTILRERLQTLEGM